MNKTEKPEMKWFNGMDGLESKLEMEIKKKTNDWEVQEEKKLDFQFPTIYFFIFSMWCEN